MRESNLFQTFKRPRSIPDDILTTAELMVAADDEYMEAAGDVGRLIQRDCETLLEKDVQVLARMIVSIVHRPSTTSPLFIAIMRGRFDTSYLCIRWVRIPEQQKGYAPEWNDTKRRMEIDLVLPVPFHVNLGVWKCFADALGIEVQRFLDEYCYVIIPQDHSSALLLN